MFCTTFVAHSSRIQALHILCEWLTQARVSVVLHHSCQICFCLLRLKRKMFIITEDILFNDIYEIGDMTHPTNTQIQLHNRNIIASLWHIQEMWGIFLILYFSEYLHRSVAICSSAVCTEMRLTDKWLETIHPTQALASYMSLPCEHWCGTSLHRHRPHQMLPRAVHRHQ